CYVETHRKISGRKRIRVRRDYIAPSLAKASQSNSERQNRWSIITAYDSGSGDRGFESYRPSHCSVSGHPGLLLQDIVDRPSAAEAEVEAVGVELELADELSVGGEDADVGGGDEEVDLAGAVLGAGAGVGEAPQA